MFFVHIRYLVDESLMLDLTGSSLFPKSELHVPAQTQYTQTVLSSCQLSPVSLSLPLPLCLCLPLQAPSPFSK